MGHTMERPLGILILHASLLLLVDGVSITGLSGPSIVEAGKELILDCDFTYTEDEVNQLVVKWFFEGSRHPFYQWVPGLDMGPQIISPEFRDIVDLSYTVEGEDQFTKFRALRIPSASLAVAGKYQCQVSSFTAEAVKETEVNVYVPPSSMSVITSSDATSNTVTLSCTAGPAFPLPKMSLYWTQHLESHTTSTPATIYEEESGLFSAMLNVSISEDTVGPEDVVECRMDLPGTGWTRTEQTEILEHKIPEKFLAMFNKDNTEDATIRDDFIAPSDYDQEREEPVIKLEKSEQNAVEESEPKTEGDTQESLQTGDSSVSSVSVTYLTPSLLLLSLTVLGLF